jgi:hypothetical protein
VVNAVLGLPIPDWLKSPSHTLSLMKRRAPGTCQNLRQLPERGAKQVSEAGPHAFRRSEIQDRLTKLLDPGLQ